MLFLMTENITSALHPVLRGLVDQLQRHVTNLLLFIPTDYLQRREDYSISENHLLAAM